MLVVAVVEGDDDGYVRRMNVVWMKRMLEVMRKEPSDLWSVGSTPK